MRTSASSRAAALLLFVTLAVLAALSADATGAHAQTTPFSMRQDPSNERAGTSTGPPRSTAEDERERGGNAPFDINEDGRAPGVAEEEEEEIEVRPSTTVSPLANGREPAAAVPVDAISEEQRRNLNLLLKQNGGKVRELRVNLASSQQEWVDSIVDRPIVPYRTLRLDGEYDASSFGVFLAAAEAARGGTLSIAFTNSVLVLPEASRLRVFLNGKEVAETAIDSPDRTKVVALPVRPELLRPGHNIIRLVTDMRHRIDCSVAATFELWTRIDTRLTGFTFERDNLPLAGLGELPAVGVGTSGATRLRVIQADPSSLEAADRMLRAVQAAALRGRFVQPLVEVADLEAGLVDEPGVLNIVIGLHDTVRAISPEVPWTGAVGPVATLVDDPEAGPTVILKGPTVRDLDTALSRFGSLRIPDEPMLAAAATPAWLAPESVRVDVARTLTLAEAGIDSIDFSGRRFEVGFQITLPPDFYAAAYGEARLLLDAVRSEAVRPGSRVLVLVNGVLSTAIDLNSSNGRILDDFPVSLSMRSFQPGVNDVEIVVELDTEADRACLPGGTVPARERFTLLSTTRLAFPHFARIGQLPHLASFATNGFPHPLTQRSLRVQIGGGSPDTAGAAGTLIARLAVSRGAPLSIRVVEDVHPHRATGVIVVSPIAQVSDTVLATTGARRAVPAEWLQASADTGEVEAEGLDRYDAALRRLREQLRQEEVGAEDDGGDRPESDAQGPDPAANDRSGQSGSGGVPDLLSSARRGIAEALDIDPGETGRNERPPLSATTTLILAQGLAPANDETAWTLLTAPTPSLLSTATAALTSQEIWNRIGGQVTGYDLERNSVEVVPATNVSFIATLPLSFTNMRLIAANWFSINNGAYAATLVICAVLLGLVTWLLVSRLGRGR